MKVRLVKDTIQIYSEYDQKFVSRIRQIPGRIFDSESRIWSIPITSLVELQMAFPKIPDVIIEKAKQNLDFNPTELKYAKVNGKPYDYQKVGASFLIRRQKCILADEMGLGKSVQALMACEELYLAGEIEHTIIFCPSTIKFTVWESELKKWIPDRNVVVIGGTRKKRKKLWATEKVHFYVVNYELVRNAFDYPIIKAITDNNDCAIVLDECVRIKSWKAKTSKAIKTLNAPYKFCLSGAPVENSPAELYSINQFLNNNMLGDWRGFDLRYIVRDIWGNIVGYKNLDDLRGRILYIMLRRRKVDVLDLPPVIEHTRMISLTPTESKEYGMLTKPVFKMLEGNVRISHVFGALTLCRLYLDHPDLLRQSGSELAQAVAKKMKTKTSSKFEEFKAMLPELEGHKVVVFSQFRKMIRILHEFLGQHSIEFRGGMSAKEKENAIQQFNENPDLQFFLSTETGAYGVHLVVADVIINYDLPWNPAKLKQRIDRLHRIGQKNTVNVINLLVEDEDKIERKVKRVLGRKEEWAKQILEGEEND